MARRVVVLPQPEGPRKHHEFVVLDRQVDVTDDVDCAEMLVDMASSISAM